MSLGCVVNNEAQGDEHSRTYQSQEAHHGPFDQHVAAGAGLRGSWALLWRGSLNGEAVVLDDVAIVGERGLDNDFLVDVAVQAEPRVPLIAQGISKVSLQVHTVQSVR